MILPYFILPTKVAFLESNTNWMSLLYKQDFINFKKEEYISVKWKVTNSLHTITIGQINDRTAPLRGFAEHNVSYLTVISWNNQLILVSKTSVMWQSTDKPLSHKKNMKPVFRPIFCPYHHLYIILILISQESYFYCVSSTFDLCDDKWITCWDQLPISAEV